MQANDNRLPAALKAGWGIGALGTTSMLYLVNLFAMFFLVRHAGVPAAIAGTIFAVTRFYDAAVDPLIGTLSDRTRSRWGRRRPWLLGGALLCPLAVVAVFNPPLGLEGNSLYLFVLCAFLLYCTAYSVFSIPYMALGTEMTDDYGERASVMAWRTFFVYSSGVVIAAGAPALVALLGSDRAAYSTMSFAAAAVVGCTMLCVVFATGRARVTERSAETLDARAWFRTVASNTPYLTILLTKMTLQLGTAFTGAAMLFFMSYVLGKGEGALARYNLVSNLVGIAAVPFWSLVLRRVERRTVFIGLLLGNLVGYLSWMLATPQEPDTLFLARAVFQGSVGSGSVLVALAMLTDTIELDRLTTGQRREGLFVGGFELMQTTSFVVGPLVVGFAFSAAGLVPGDAGKGAQPESALQMMRFAVSVVPAVSCAAGILLLALYRLDARRLAELRAAAS
ncbi:MAG: glycoside-pentoside-hexuronide (GPH):cation symporter [Steroidobacteraceae bacterium]|jgi:GPH family glycoside/pentoside/hexuronide:cation symporter|nr:glycoside-pentoside-hexuronide (GPH):cation symporter [Steroidobacteraceae bacterium]